MDSIRVSEAPDPSSILGIATSYTKSGDSLTNRRSLYKANPSYGLLLLPIITLL